MLLMVRVPLLEVTVMTNVTVPETLSTRSLRYRRDGIVVLKTPVLPWAIV